MNLKTLLEKIRGHEVDSVLAVFPDMLGRWMGKRVAGRFFADTVAQGGLHACAYLLTVDMEMEPVQGFELTSWEKSAIAKEAFGEEAHRHYLHAARVEQETFDRAVTCWELARYFERI
ncbi:MAG: hypothetical protein HY399_01525 [Elusimicrobia bacterium]|nr:hypothetical protein [Elusimicrobiota bacterium]